MNKYYVRVKAEDITSFEKHAGRNGLYYELLSNDFGTSMFAMMIDDEEALNLKLSLPLVGCLKLNQARSVDSK